MLDERQVARRLEAWYRRHARDLPWRRDARDPYRVWVSEVMLQQTQVKTVIPYYERWMQHLPTVEALAAAPLEEVLGLWSGLGYYARCRNLHRAARRIVEVHAGRLPEDPGALEALPGIGRYTAGAIRSIAFQKPAPIVDGNVARVLLRLYGKEGDPGNAAVSRWLWSRAERLVQRCGRPGDFNQALMELGATVCTPAAPACEVCPVAVHCAARRTGRCSEIPTPRRRPKRHARSGLVALATRGEERWLARRKASGLLGGLWEPPIVAAKEVAEATALGSVTHTFTHLELTLHVFGLACPAGTEGPRPDPEIYEEARWVRTPESLPLSRLARKILALA